MTRVVCFRLDLPHESGAVPWSSHYPTMPNQLTFPSKRSYPADVRSALKAYIHEKHPETHPDAFKWDIAKWESCRAEAIKDYVHEERIPKILTCVQLPLDQTH